MHASGLSRARLGTGIMVFSCFNDEDAEKVEEVMESKEHGGKGVKRKGKSFGPKKKGKDSMVKIMSRMVEDIISTNSVISKALQGDYIVESIKKVMTLVKESGAYEGSDEHFMATKLFVKAENRIIFTTFDTNEGRLNWLKRCYEEL